jgi:hypothetical protein
MDKSLPDIAEILLEIFPLIDPLQNSHMGCSDIQFCHGLISKFVGRVVEVIQPFSETKIPRIMLDVSNCFSAGDRDRFCEIYIFGEFIEPKDRNSWEDFLKNINYKLLRAVQPDEAIFLSHIKYISARELWWVLNFFRRSL